MEVFVINVCSVDFIPIFFVVVRFDVALVIAVDNFYFCRLRNYWIWVETRFLFLFLFSFITIDDRRFAWRGGCEFDEGLVRAGTQRTLAKSKAAKWKKQFETKFLILSFFKSRKLKTFFLRKSFKVICRECKRRRKSFRFLLGGGEFDLKTFKLKSIGNNDKIVY